MCRKEVNYDNEERETKRRHLVASSDSCEESNEFTEISNSSVNNSNEAMSGPMPPQLPPGYNTWWDSTDTFMLFNGNKDIQTAVDQVSDLIAVLDGANKMAMSYKIIVEGNATDDKMSENKKESIKMKARYLPQAYQIALDSMPYKTWLDCCQEAINILTAIHTDSFLFALSPQVTSNKALHHQLRIPFSACH